MKINSEAGRLNAIAVLKSIKAGPYPYCYVEILPVFQRK